ncbi:ras-like protein family member 10B isoform X1 [Leucoraja erinacea]|uniref:ras-like protein family member 10B isoform X1 n=1 Tax=Leucoraja erinaceus TaxID=7782 RepID=UPI0024576E20|nr:ras-like protein family member 10B isoform X1 [Leucoraja erinacea]
MLPGPLSYSSTLCFAQGVPDSIPSPDQETFSTLWIDGDCETSHLGGGETRLGERGECSPRSDPAQEAGCWLLQAMSGTFTIALLGCPGVGKTAIIRQFLYNDFSPIYSPTRGRQVHRASVMLDGDIYDLKIVDVPHIPTFPTTGAQEWTDSRCRGIRNANAYILVYDICCLDSFDYVKMIRQQIAEVRCTASRSFLAQPTNEQSPCFGVVCEERVQSPSPVHVLEDPHSWRPNTRQAPIIVVGNKRDLQKHRFTPRRSTSDLVKRMWRCGYIECSARYNWHLLLLFKELLNCSVDPRYKQGHPSIRIQGALQRNRCNVM